MAVPAETLGQQRGTRKPWFLSLARLYARRRLKQAFDGVIVSGLQHVRAATKHGPIVIAATHVAWWDAFVVVLLDQLLDTESYCLMDRDNLKELPFFGWIGALPLDRKSVRAGVRDLLAGAAVLDGPGRVLWIFPQGSQRPSHIRPLGFTPGASVAARRGSAPVVPLSLTYQFGNAAKPLVLLRFGEPLDRASTTPDDLARLEREIEEGLAEIDRFLAAGAPEPHPHFVRILGRPTGEVPLAGRLLTRLGRGGGVERDG